MKEVKEVVYETRSGNDVLSPDTANMLINIARWTKFIAIVVFVLIGIALISIISAGATVNSMNAYMDRQGDVLYTPGVFSWTYAIIGIIYLLVFFVPTWYLFQFSSRIMKTFDPASPLTVKDAVSSLQKHYMFIGVLIAIWLVFMLIGILMIMFGLM